MSLGSIQYDWHPKQRKKIGHSRWQREDSMKTQGEDDSL